MRDESKDKIALNGNFVCAAVAVVISTAIAAIAVCVKNVMAIIADRL